MADSLESQHTLEPQLTVQGNQKTKLSYLKAKVNECLEEQSVLQWADVDSDELQQCLLDTRLFSEVQLSINAPVVSITVKERWTIIPIPYVSVQSDSSRYGFFLFDSNFLGRGKQAVIGASTGTRGNTFFTLYRDPAIFYGKWTGVVKYRQGQEDYLRYQKETEFDGYSEKTNNGELRLGYKFSPWIEAALQVEFTRRRFDVLEPYTLSLQDYSYVYLGPFFTYEHTDFHFYFLQGNKLRLELGSQVYRSDDAKQLAQYQLVYDWQHAVYKKNALQLHLQSLANNTDDVRDSFKLGGNLGFRGVESAGIWAKQAHSASLDYKIPFLDVKYGTWTIGPFIDYAQFKSFDATNNQESTAYGISAFMFLKKIALPGIGINVGHNDNYLGDFVSVSIGFAL
ncbi:MAG: BamA/TamA family outer membrane protein [Gammaproteobacteria bacterium]|nr:BamA/TamA family outer membrane protein [Gammaproteobacteria bacterium]